MGCRNLIKSGRGSQLRASVENEVRIPVEGVAEGAATGVMLCVSFVEFFLKGAQRLTAAYGEHRGPWINTAASLALLK